MVQVNVSLPVWLNMENVPHLIYVKSKQYTAQRTSSVLSYPACFALPWSLGTFLSINSFFFPPLFFFASFLFFLFFFCEQQKSGPEADMWNRLFFHFISFIQRYSILSFYLKMNHKNPPTRSAVSACFFGCSVCQIYLKVFIKFCWQIGFKRPLIRFWWRSRSGI